LLINKYVPSLPVHINIEHTPTYWENPCPVITMCWTIHYRARCGHLTSRARDRQGVPKGSKLVNCIVGEHNPLRCDRMKEEVQKKNAYWLSRDCVDCVERYEERMRKMRVAVRDNARKIREEYGLPSPTYARGERENRCAHMDVGR